MPLIQPLDDSPILVPSGLPVPTKQSPSVNNQNFHAEDLRQQKELNPKEEIIEKVGITDQKKKVSKDPKSSTTTTPSKKRTSTSKSSKSTDKEANSNKQESKKSITPSKGGLPDFSRKLSDIKARLKPVEDTKPNKPSLESKKSLDSVSKKPPEISTFKPVLQREISNLKKPISNEGPSVLSEGPLCPMHAHAKLANQRKVSKDDLKNINTENTDNNKSEPESTINKAHNETRKFSEPVYESVKSGLPVSRKQSETTERQRPSNRKLSETGNEDKQRTPSNSSDDNLLSDRSERSERSGASNEVTSGTMTLGRKKKKAPPPPIATGTFII